MKRSTFIHFFALIAALTLFAGCGKDKTPPVSERIAKRWTATKVEESNTVVYTKGGATNVRPGYANFLLDLSSPSSVTLKEFEGSSFTGTWEVQGENRLILKGLTPQPTNTNGTIEFTINSINDTELVLTRTTANQKTGGTINKYTLAP